MTISQSERAQPTSAHLTKRRRNCLFSVTALALLIFWVRSDALYDSLDVPSPNGRLIARATSPSFLFFLLASNYEAGAESEVRVKVFDPRDGEAGERVTVHVADALEPFGDHGEQPVAIVWSADSKRFAYISSGELGQIEGHVFRVSYPVLMARKSIQPEDLQWLQTIQSRRGRRAQNE